MAHSGEDEQITDPPERGVLTSLPSTRPQRPSARRAAARDTAAKGPTRAKRGATAKRPTRAKRDTAADATPDAAASGKERGQGEGNGEGVSAAGPAARGRARAGTDMRARRPPRRSTAARPARHTSPQEPRIPPQGFETEEEIAPGSTVHPPSRPELAAAVADLLGELAQGGLTAGGRLLKDFLGKLPGV